MGLTLSAWRKVTYLVIRERGASNRGIVALGTTKKTWHDQKGWIRERLLSLTAARRRQVFSAIHVVVKRTTAGMLSATPEPMNFS
ncbi:MAG: hypothetical protein WCI74_13660, partial [Actinomycetes bacterium]